MFGFTFALSILQSASFHRERSVRTPSAGPYCHIRQQSTGVRLPPHNVGIDKPGTISGPSTSGEGPKSQPNLRTPVYSLIPSP